MAQEPSSVTVVAGPWKGRRFNLPLYPADVVIGSDPTSSIVLPLPGVAAQHATLRNVAEGTWVLDAGSPGGVFVNGERIAEYRPIVDGDVVSLGPDDERGVQLTCHLVPLAAEVPTEEETPVEEPAWEQASPHEVAEAVDAEEIVEGAWAPGDGGRSVQESSPPDVVADDGFFVEDAGVESGPAPGPVPPPEADQFFVEDAPDATATIAGFSEGGFPSAADVEPTAAQPGAEDFFVADETSPPVPAPEAFAEEDFFVAEAAPEEPPSPPEAGPRVPPPLKIPPPLKAPPPAEAGPTPPVAREAIHPSAKARQPEVGPGQRQTPPAAARGVVRSARPVGGPARPAPRPLPRRRGAGRWIVAAGGVLVLGVTAWGLVAWLRRPVVSSAEPNPARVGDIVTLRGERLGGGRVPEVLFNGQRGSVESSGPQAIVVRVPDLHLPPGQDVMVPIKVKVRGPFSGATSVRVRQVPQINGLSPDVAVSGEEVVVAGAGWGSGTVQVTVNGTPAQVLQTQPSFIRIRVPGLPVSQGTILRVVVSNGTDASNAADLIFGRLPVVTTIEPREAGAGDVITVRGRGFRAEPSGQAVRVAGVPALVSVASQEEIKVVFPIGVPPGQATVDVRVDGNPNVAVGVVASKPLEEQIRAGIVPQPHGDGSDAKHADLVTPLGPLMILTTEGGSTAAQRAIAAAASLNEGLGQFRTSLAADLEIRTQGDKAVIALAGGGAELLQVTPADAAAYSDGWGGRATSVSVGRLANWWSALLRDYALLAMRAERPHYTAALAAEGRALAVAFDSMARVGGPGISVAGLAALSTQERESLRLLALRVPSSVPEPQPLAKAAVPQATLPTKEVPPLKLDGTWQGFEMTASGRRNISVRFEAGAGTVSLEGAVSISMPILSVAPGRNSVAFEVRGSGGRQYYNGKWDGERISGAIGDRPGGDEVGTFELWR